MFDVSEGSRGRLGLMRESFLQSTFIPHFP